MPLTLCQICKSEFYVKPTHKKRGWGIYCSISCRTKGQLQGKTFPCYVCSKEVYRSPLDIKKSKSGKYFCNKTCQTIWRNKILFIGENYLNWKNGKSAYRSILEAEGIKKQCTICYIEDERVIIVHHIDKDRTNNNVTNLIWLCNNCHYLVHHYKEEQKKLYSIIKK